MLFWEMFDFFSVSVAALTMMLFVAVVFKATNLWISSLWRSVYIWIFAVLAVAGVWGIFAEESAAKDTLHAMISTFIAGTKGEVIQAESVTVDTGYEITGTVTDTQLADDVELDSLDEELIVLSGAQATGFTQTGVLANSGVMIAS